MDTAGTLTLLIIAFAFAIMAVTRLRRARTARRYEQYRRYVSHRFTDEEERANRRAFDRWNDEGGTTSSNDAWQ